VLGEAELATAEKGRQAYEEAVKQLTRFVTWFCGSAEGCPQGSAPTDADDADPVGTTAGEVTAAQRCFQVWRVTVCSQAGSRLGEVAGAVVPGEHTDRPLFGAGVQLQVG